MSKNKTNQQKQCRKKDETQPELRPEFIKKFKQQIKTAKYSKYSSIEEMFEEIERQ